MHTRRKEGRSSEDYNALFYGSAWTAQFLQLIEAIEALASVSIIIGGLRVPSGVVLVEETKGKSEPVRGQCRVSKVPNAKTRRDITFANIFVHKLEKQLFLTEPYTQFIVGYYRFVDDILVIWDGPVKRFEEMIQVANEAHPTIKFTTEIGGHSINFLDVTLKFEDGRINTGLYRKSTDKNNILHASSYHTHNVIKAIPKGEFIRARIISSKAEDYKLAANNLKERFIKRGYKPKTVETCSKEVGEMKRDQLLMYKAKSDQKCFPFDKTLRKVLTKPPLFSYTKGKSLRDSLCQAEISHTKKGAQGFLGTPKMGTFPCFNCICCQTLRSVKTHIKEHRVLEIVKPLTRGGDMLKYRLQREAFWIKKLDTLQPKALGSDYSRKGRGEEEQTEHAHAQGKEV
ncbi:hypothetical protein XELAEV_18027687mg [Xenopus laevis]|uniref:Helix-turn-helix domain-containing protein n=1 Tax=Xenopus laevis TaxID=8355 RepID=A0A974CY62_XENLA|nr:hypothetical protein XELAEV_18027687mg [Xenopus laevis]